MSARIGEVLIEQKACSRQQIAEGLQNQVIFGGRLGTNLLELGHVDEASLARGLGRRHGVPCLAGDLRPDPGALALLTAEQVDRFEAVPYLAEGRKLAILVCDPNDLARDDEVAFSTGKQVRALVVPEARLWHLMHRCYGLDRSLRGIELEDEGLPRPAQVKREEGRPAAGPDLMTEDQFDALYRAALPGGKGAVPVRELPADPAALRSLAEPVLELTEADVLGSLPATPPEPAGRALGAPRPTPPGDLGLPGFPGVLGFLGFEEAMQLLEKVGDRSAVARTVLRYASSRFKRVLLLTVHRGIAQGWDGIGEGLDPAAVRRVQVKLREPSAVTTVVTTRAHFLGPLQRTRANIQFLQALRGGAPRNSLLLPILVQGRVVNVLYADNGRGGRVDSEVGELLILATKISQSYESLLSTVSSAVAAIRPADGPGAH